MQDTNSNALTWVLGGALVLIGLFVVILLVSVNSQADSVSTSATVTNVSPTITMSLAAAGSSVPASTTATLSSGTTKTFTISGTITDNNGVGTTFANGDLTRIETKLRRSDTTCNSDANNDNNNCYWNDSTTGNCALGTQNSTTNIDYSCTFAVQYYSDSTSTGGTYAAGTWLADASVIDDSSAQGTATQLSYEMGTLLSLNIPATIAYGTLAREASTTNSNNQEMTLTQYGNDEADVEVSGTTMPCTVVGTIPIANQEWGLTDLSANTVGVTDLTGSAVDTNIAVGYRTNDASALTKILYWNITIPNVASGSCTGTNTITAIAAQ